jgi:hypothetical protein
MSDYTVFNKNYISFQSDHGGKNSTPREHDYSLLMDKKKKEHSDMFGNSNESDIEEKKTGIIPKESVASFLEMIHISSKTLTRHSGKIKKESGRSILKKAALTLASTALALCQELIVLIISLDSEEGIELEQRLLDIRKLIPLLENYIKLLQNIDVENSTKSEYKQQCQLIIQYSLDMQNGINDLILHTPIIESSLVQESLNTFKSRSNKLTKTIKKSQDTKPDKIPLMGTEGL